MKESLQKLTKYNAWANQKHIENLLLWDESVLRTTTSSSFSTIRETCQHIWLGEQGWLSRMNNLGWQTEEIEKFNRSTTELFEAWQSTSREYIKFAETEKLDSLTNFVHDNTEYSIKRSDIILTIINHGNYHRGQIVTILHQLDINTIPKTDYIEWIREQEKVKIEF